MFRISLKFGDVWQVLDCLSVVDHYSLSESFVNPRDFRGELSTLNLQLRLSGSLLTQFLDAPDNIPAMVEENGNLVFGGFLENLYSSQEHRLIGTPDFYLVSFKVRSWLSWFDFELSTPFNPYVDLTVVEPLPICDPANPSRSLLHKLLGALGAPFALADDLVIPDTSFSFVIKEKENVLGSLQDLFWGLARILWIDASGLIRSSLLQTTPDAEDIPFLWCLVDFSHTRPKREYTSLRLEWASTLYKSRAVLLAEKKAIYSEASRTLDDEGKPEPLFRLVPQGDYPVYSTTNETFQRPTAEFLQTNYTWDYIEEGIFGTKSPKNRDLSVVALWDFDLAWQGDERLERQYFKTKSDAFAFSFVNPLPLPDENFEDAVLDLDYLDVYSSTLYRTKRNFLRAVEPKQLRGISDVLSRPSFREQEILLLYTNEKATARRFFDLHANRLRHGGTTFSFGSLENLELGSFYAVKSAGQIFRFLVTKKTQEKGSKLIRYEALNQLAVEPVDAEESEEGGSWERPVPNFDYSLSARSDGLQTKIFTDYISDERTLPSVDEQARIFGGTITFDTSLFFVAKTSFNSPANSVRGAVLRHRPLSPPTFGAGSSVSVLPRLGVLIQSRVLTAGDAIVHGERETIFRIT